ncbi:zinc dependent phospholipase C family protein [Pedobacter gandavensis]|uniref:S1/P1 Nuclease n=1 Tax=Pedobacter gandavensis TaxID=2679963 RepID=A0ABR6F1V1_9SPHI|nr:zinc dependent phospholipase C family protein [Pedobacter gandavensis]MBB2151503.1 S1/P1 Nuclease [Pedobacter gandavensis]
MNRVFIPVLLFSLLILCSSWGFYAHQRINYLAVFTLHNGLNTFYKANINYLSEHAVDADKRRYADTAEAPRHYLDVECYETNIDSIPRKWNDALKKYGAKKLQTNGTLPWQIQKSYFKLVRAFTEQDSLKILIYSAYLGHYISDAHVPLHTTQNHNGQLTNQHGIHAFWESRLPELFASRYNFQVGKAIYMEDPLKAAWKMVSNSHRLLDSVLAMEMKVSLSTPGRKKYSFSKRQQLLIRQYSLLYSTAYHLEMNQMVERQMRAAIHATGSFWYSAWIDAGQPTLKNMPKKNAASSLVKELEAAPLPKDQGLIIGREPN